jgi:hypothetical protein
MNMKMIKQHLLRDIMIVFGLLISGLNIYMVTMPTNTQPAEQGGGNNNNNNNNYNNNNNVRIGADFYQSHKVVEESKLQVSTTNANNNNNNVKSKILLGIISSDTFNDLTYRRRHRELIQLWNDPRVCSLAEFKRKMDNHNNIINNDNDNDDDCQIVYSFVLGGADPVMDKDAPTELLSNTTHRPIERAKPVAMTHATDSNDGDMTLLNIRYVLTILLYIYIHIYIIYFNYFILLEWRF